MARIPPIIVDVQGGPIMRAKKTAMVTDARGKRRKITKGVTTAHGSAQIVIDKPHLWGPLEVDFPADPVAAADPVVPARNPTQNLAAPDLSTGLPRDNVVIAKVRKWAQEQGIPVSKSGYIAKDVIERYIAAHS